MPEEQIKILDGNTLVISDARGDIEASPTDPMGLFSFDTRFLSRWVLTINGQRSPRCEVALPDQLGPAAPVDEQVLERHRSQQPVVDRVDQRQPLAELASAAGELEVVALLELAARPKDTQPVGLPPGHVLGLEAARQHEVDAQRVVDARIGDHRLGREQVNDAAVRVGDRTP
jgi:N-terminal domain of (some) glycogen debranching enzymes